MAYTTDRLLDSIRRGITMPSNQVRFDDDDLLALADEETEAVILPMLLGIRQDFLVKQKDVPLVAEQARYKIPYRAVGRKLRDLKLANSDGVVIRNIPLIDQKDRNTYTPEVSGDPRAYTIEGEYVVMLPTPAEANQSLQMFYELAPSRLVATDQAGTITNIDTGTGIVTISAEVSDFVTGDTMDFVDGKTGNSVLAEDVVNTNVATTAITFDTDDLPDSLAVGDYVTQSDESPVVQLPEELIQSLVQAVICRIMESQGDIEMLERGVARLEKKLKAAAALLTPRVESSQKVIVNRNGLLTQRPFHIRYRLTP